LKTCSPSFWRRAAGFDLLELAVSGLRLSGLRMSQSFIISDMVVLDTNHRGGVHPWLWIYWKPRSKKNGKNCCDGEIYIAAGINWT
jgi:hypothetical protein